MHPISDSINQHTFFIDSHASKHRVPIGGPLSTADFGGANLQVTCRYISSPCGGGCQKYTKDPKCWWCSDCFYAKFAAVYQEEDHHSRHCCQRSDSRFHVRIRFEYVSISAPDRSSGWITALLKWLFFFSRRVERDRIVLHLVEAICGWVWGSLRGFTWSRNHFGRSFWRVVDKRGWNL